MGVDLHSQLSAFARRHGLWSPGDRIAIAVSGGSDSTALLTLLAELADSEGLVLSVAHYDHRWRADSAADVAFVAAMARGLGLPFHVERAAEPASARDREQTARRARYDFFRRLVASGEVMRVATAHTADDQAETVLLRILRGSGPQGLAGILPRRDDGAVIRPLLIVRRGELRAYLEGRGQDWREDPSNHDLTHARNRVRQEILPALSAMNPALVERLATLAEVARGEEEYWVSVVARASESLLQPLERGVRIERKELAQLPLALQRRLIRAALARVRGDLRRIEFRAVDEILQWMDAGDRRPRRLDLPGAVCRLSRAYLDVLQADAL